MKIIITQLVLLLAFCRQVAAVPNGPVANRMQHCRVTSVAGNWAMQNYPKTVDIYYGTLTSQNSWQGLLIFGFPSNEPIFNLDKMEVFPVKIQSFQSARYAGDTATGTNENIKFKFEKFDWIHRVSIFSLFYIQDSGTYSCQIAWPVGLPH